MSLLSFGIFPGRGHICIRQEANILECGGVNHLKILPFTLQEISNIKNLTLKQWSIRRALLPICLLQGSLPACALSFSDYHLNEFSIMSGSSLGSTLAKSCKKKKNIKTRQSFNCKMPDRGCHWPLSVHPSVRIFSPILMPLSSPSCPLSQV